MAHASGSARLIRAFGFLFGMTSAACSTDPELVPPREEPPVAGSCGYEQRRIITCPVSGAHVEDWIAGCAEPATACESAGYAMSHDNVGDCAVETTYRNVGWVESCDAWLGEVAAEQCECEVGDLRCEDDDTAGMCKDGCRYSAYSCSDVCPGDQFSYRTGCREPAQSLTELCGCQRGGMGDPCDGSGACGTGWCGGWCTRVCTQSSDCEGDGPDGVSAAGLELVCAGAGPTGYCFPACETDADCLPFGARCETFIGAGFDVGATARLCTF